MFCIIVTGIIGCFELLEYSKGIPYNRMENSKYFVNSNFRCKYIQSSVVSLYLSKVYFAVNNNFDSNDLTKATTLKKRIGEKMVSKIWKMINVNKVFQHASDERNTTR